MTTTLTPAPATTPTTCAMPRCGATLTGVTGYIDDCGTVCEDCFGPTLEQILGPGWDRPLPF